MSQNAKKNQWREKTSKKRVNEPLARAPSFGQAHLRSKHLHHAPLSEPRQPDPVLPDSLRRPHPSGHLVHHALRHVHLKPAGCAQFASVHEPVKGKAGGAAALAGQWAGGGMVAWIPDHWFLTFPTDVCMTKEVIQIYVYGMLRWLLTRTRPHDRWYYVLVKNSKVGAFLGGNTAKGTPLLPWPANCRCIYWPWRACVFYKQGDGLLSDFRRPKKERKSHNITRQYQHYTHINIL
jgi:hypothetical protein